MLQSRLEFYLAQLRLQKKEKLAPALPPTLALDNNGITKYNYEISSIQDWAEQEQGIQAYVV